MQEMIKSTEIALAFDGSLQPLLDKIEAEVSSIVPDTSTRKGRDEIKSLAYRVTKSKTAIDAKGKELVDSISLQMKEFTDKKALINASRKESNAFLKTLSEKVRQPLTEYEEEEATKIKEQLFEKKWDEALQKNILFDKEAALKKKEFELNEKQRLIDEETARIARDEIIREQEKAKVEQARLAAIEAEKRAIKAQAGQAIAIKEAKIREEAAKKQAESDRIEALRLAKSREVEAELRAKEMARVAKIEKDNAVAHEAQRLEREKVLKEQKAKANLAHVKKVNNEALSCLILSGIDEITAKKVVIAIAKGDVAHIKMEY